MIIKPDADPTAQWLHSERHLHLGSRPRSQFASINEVDARYRPESNAPTFQLSCARAQTKASGFFANDHPLSAALRALYAPSPDTLHIPIHPAAARFITADIEAALEWNQCGLVLSVSPTASTRTMLVIKANVPEDIPRHALKAHFPGRISRFTRPISRNDVEFQLWVSQQLSDADIPLLAEIAGGYVEAGGQSIGFLLRDNRPSTARESAHFMVPGFALYALDAHETDDPPLLVQLQRRFAESPTAFVIQRIIEPAIRLWLTAVTERGIIPELHGQNLLFCFDADFKSSTLCMRDCDLFVDAHRRDEIGLTTPDHFLEAAFEPLRRARPRILSLCYDGFLISQFIEAVAACAWRHLGVRRNALRAAAIEVFHEQGGAALAMPRKAYYFDDRLHPDRAFVLKPQPNVELWR